MSVFRQQVFTSAQLDISAHHGCRRKTSTCAQSSVSVLDWDTRYIHAVGWCPGEVVFSLQSQLLVSYKQPKRIVPIWDALGCEISKRIAPMLAALDDDFCMSPEVSSTGVNGSEAPHDLGRGVYLLSAMMVLSGIAVAHRFSVLGC